MPAPEEKRKIAINASSNGLTFAVKVVVAFVVQPILVIGLGDERMGMWLLVNSILTYMAMADLGIGAAVLRFVARFEGLDDTESVNRVFNCSMLMFGCIGAVLLLVALILAYAWHQPFGVDPEIASDARWLLALLGVNLAIGFPLGLYRSVLSGLGDYPTINILTVASLLIRNTFFVAVTWAGGGLLGIGVSVTFCGIWTYLAFAFFAYRRLPSLRLSRDYIDSGTFRTLFSYSAGVFTAMTAGRVANATIPIVIGAFLGPLFVTYYTVAAYVPTFAGDGIRTMLAVLTQSFSRMHAQGNLKEIRSLFLTIARSLHYVTFPVMLGVAFWGHTFLDLWMGKKYADAGGLVIAVLAAPLPLTLLHTLSLRLLHGFGKVRFVAIATIASACIAVGVSVAFVDRLGIIGVAAAVSLSQVLLAIAMVAYACTVIDLRPFRFILSSMAKPSLHSVVLVAVWILIRHECLINSWHAFFATLLAGLMPYGLFVCVFDPEIRNVLGRCVRSVKGNRAGHNERAFGDQAEM